jgi:hypothetical protein
MKNAAVLKLCKAVGERLLVPNLDPRIIPLNLELKLLFMNIEVIYYIIPYQLVW